MTEQVDVISGWPLLGGTVHRCIAIRDLFAGTGTAGTVILSCDKPHHMESSSHRMTNPDGSVTTWRR